MIPLDFIGQEIHAGDEVVYVVKGHGSEGVRLTKAVVQEIRITTEGVALSVGVTVLHRSGGIWSNRVLHNLDHVIKIGGPSRSAQITAAPWAIEGFASAGAITNPSLH